MFLYEFNQIVAGKTKPERSHPNRWLPQPASLTQERCASNPVILGSSVLVTYRDGNAPASSFIDGDGAG
jgi:hypothetical protein